MKACKKRKKSLFRILLNLIVVKDFSIEFIRNGIKKIEMIFKENLYTFHRKSMNNKGFNCNLV